MSSSDSSDDDSGLLSRISEAAIDPHKHLGLKTKDRGAKDSVTSNRHDRQAESGGSGAAAANNLLRVQVTPEFQNFVAKKLSAVLEGSVEEVQDAASTNPSSSDVITDDSGIRLFAKSSKILTRGDDFELQSDVHRRPNKPMRRKRKKIRLESSSSNMRECGSSSSEIDEEMIKESAVDCEWVMQKKGAYPDDRQRTAPIDVIKKKC